MDPEAFIGEQMSAVDAHDVAAMRFGPGSRAVSCTPLSGGLANQGVFVHEVRGPGGELRGRLVEKVTTRRIEAALAACTMRAGIAPDEVLAKVHAIGGEPGRYRLFMEHVGGIGAPAFLATDHATQLAAALVRLNALFDQFRTSFRLEFPVLPVFDERQQSRLERIIEPEIAPQAMSMLAEIRAVAMQYPPVLGHNDLYWPNIGHAGDGANAHAIFIDLGLAGYNLPGAELHHFAQRAEKGDEHRAFFIALTREYAGMMQFPVALVRMGACFYASYRAFTRNMRKGSGKRPHDQPLRLLRHARRALSELSL